MEASRLVSDLSSLLAGCGVEPLAYIEDDYVRNFDHRSASVRAFKESMEESFSARGSVEEKIIWQLQRLCAIAVKLAEERNQSEARFLAREQQHLQKKQLLEEGIQEAEEQLKTQEDLLARIEATIAELPEGLADVASEGCTMTDAPLPQTWTDNAAAAEATVWSVQGNDDAEKRGGDTADNAQGWAASDWNEAVEPAAPGGDEGPSSSSDENPWADLS
jgi:hypothetical protein